MLYTITLKFTFHFIPEYTHETLYFVHAHLIPAPHCINLSFLNGSAYRPLGFNEQSPEHMSEK